MFQKIIIKAISINITRNFAKTTFPRFLQKKTIPRIFQNIFIKKKSLSYYNANFLLASPLFTKNTYLFIYLFIYIYISYIVNISLPNIFYPTKLLPIVSSIILSCNHLLPLPLKYIHLLLYFS